MTRATGIALGLALVACAPRPAPPEPGPAPEPDAPVITLERTHCFGRCPVYRISLSAAGIVRYDGEANVKHFGTAVDTIPAAEVDSLVQELGRRGYFGFAAGYVLNSPACGLYSTDSPAAITSVAAGARRKQIRHDYGCSNVPAELTLLEARIDEVAGSSRWTGR